MNNFVNKNKILNDPIYGFISIPTPLIFDLLEHPYFQRLRRITQLGLTYLVYPGAYHTRFHHALGALHLMQEAVSILRNKGHEITAEEAEGVYIAILLHDIGHGPFSHALEYAIITGVNHEWFSIKIMEKLNEEFDGKLELAIKIFKNEYPKKFLHQLISSQLDMDRLDYLRRDSFYTGVTEGAINSERLLTMLNVANDKLVIDAKGIYSVEKFIMARSLMYWQVYLHKAVLSAEYTLVYILRRAKELAQKGDKLFASSALAVFLENQVSKVDFEKEESWLNAFSRLDDVDIMGAIKEWCLHPDFILSNLCQRIVHRKLLKIEMSVTPFTEEKIAERRNAIQDYFSVSRDEADFLLINEKISVGIYDDSKNKIELLYKSGETIDVKQSEEQLNLKQLPSMATRYFLCYPEEIRA